MSYEDIVDVLEEKYGIEKAEDEARSVMEIVDVDKSNSIEFSEWIMATIDKENLLCK